MTGLTPEWRKRIYLGVSALLTLAAIYGLVDQAQATQWLTLATAILGVGMGGLAAANTAPQEPPSIVDEVAERVRDGLDSWGR